MAWRDDYAKFIGQYPHKYGAELGVLQGKLSVALLDGLPGLEKLYCVDHWGSHEKIMNYLGNTKHYKNRIKTLWMKTNEAPMFVPDSSLDFVFVDASHVYRNVVTDIVCWMPKIKIGGIMSGHDYIDYEGEHHYGVKEAVDKLFPHANIQGQIWWVVNKGDKKWELWKNA